MTELDKKLIEAAQLIYRWKWRDISLLVSIADTEEARQRLTEIQNGLYDSTRETL